MCCYQLEHICVQNETKDQFTVSSLDDELSLLKGEFTVPSFDSLSTLTNTLGKRVTVISLLEIFHKLSTDLPSAALQRLSNVTVDHNKSLFHDMSESGSH